MPTLIRNATRADQAFIRELCLTAFGVYGPSYPDEIAGRRFGREDHRFLIAEEDGAPLGFSMVEHVAGSPVAHLHAVAVAPEQRRRGIAGQLLKSVIEDAGEIGATTLELIVAEENTAGRETFGHAGFVVMGPAPGRYPNGQGALIMRMQPPPA